MKNLLTPRCEVLADYFYSPYKVGDIIEPNERGTVHLTTTVQYDSFDGQNHDVVNFMPFETVTKYPHLFRKLAWYEKRDIKDMPEYVKKSFSKEVIRIDEISNLELMISKGFVMDEDTADIIAFSPVFFNNYIPATATEYENFIKNK